MLSIMGKNKFWSICTKYAEDEMYRVQNENERTTDTCHKWVGSQIHLPWQFCLCQVQNTQNCPVVFSSGAWRRLTLGSDQEGKPQGIRRPGDISDVLLCLIYWPRWRLPVCICSVVIHRAIHVWEVCVLSQVLWWPNKKSFSEIVCRCRSHNS